MQKAAVAAANVFQCCTVLASAAHLKLIAFRIFEEDSIIRLGIFCANFRPFDPRRTSFADGTRDVIDLLRAFCKERHASVIRPVLIRLRNAEKRFALVVGIVLSRICALANNAQA